MNDNPFETPNPLNSAEPNNTQPVEPTNPISQPVAGGPINGPEPVGPIAPAEPKPVEPVVSAEPEPMAPVAPKPVLSTEPINNPMSGPMPSMQAANLGTESPIKPKKAGLIAGIIVAVVVFVGAIAAVAFMLLGANSGDRFSEAIAKILNKNTPEKVKINGNMNIDIAEDSMLGAMLGGVSNVNLQMSSKMNLSNFENSSSIKLSLMIAKQKSEIDLEETYLADKGLYIKFNDLGLPNMELPEEMKAKWLQISDSNNLSDIIPESIPTNITSCVSNNLSKIDLTKLYNTNAFLVSTKDNSIQSKLNPVYKVNINYEKLANFINSLTELEEVKNTISECTKQETDNLSDVYGVDMPAIDTRVDYSEGSRVDFEQLKSFLPESFYVEINDKNDITRFYLENSISELNIDYKIDFTLEQPETLDITAPSDATSLEEIMLGDLQDSQRDTQRRNDMARVDTSLVQYQTNNMGNLPNSDDAITSASVWQAGVSGSSNCGDNEACNFVQKYLNNGNEDTFKDPDGTPYSVAITCNWANPNCNKGATNGTSELAPTGDEDGAYTIKDTNDGLAFDAHTIYIVPGGRCNNNGVIESTRRHLAVLYTLESAGVYCVDDQ